MRYLRQRNFKTNLYKNKHQKYQLIGHKETVSALKAHNGVILTGSHDKMVKLWNINKGKAQSFSGHSNSVTHVLMTSNGPLSCSIDKTLRLWDVKGE